MKKKYKKLKAILDNDRHLNSEDLPQPLGPEIRTCWPGNTCSRRRHHFHSELKTWHHGWRASSHCEGYAWHHCEGMVKNGISSVLTSPMTSI